VGTLAQPSPKGRTRETIVATLTALATGQIKSKEFPVEVTERMRTDTIRQAPGFGLAQLPASGQLPSGGAMQKEN
jgi:hypothetical protein